MRILDCTVGYGGHAERLLERIGPSGAYVGMDRDAEALNDCRNRLKAFGDRLRLVHANYGDIDRVCRQNGFGLFDAILADCGLSSPQLDDAGRGFSFAQPGPLDMRMDRTQKDTLRLLMDRCSEKELADWIYLWGEERYSRRIARAIKQADAERRVEDTRALAELIRRSVPPQYRHGRIHPATRTFQALRIATNGELEALETLVRKGVDHLRFEGRMAVITFHSLEDRIVKRGFLALKKTGQAQLIFKKPVVPGREEIERNPRARSAKLRVMARTQVE